MICGFCKKKTKMILNLGKTPIANSFLTKKNIKNREKKFKLSLNFCNSCFLVQAPREVNSKEIFNEEYVYFSSTSKSWSDHAKRYCKTILKKINLKKNSKIIEVASNDGYLLRNFDKKKFSLLGIEPSKNTAKKCERDYRIPVIKDFLNLKLIKKKKLQNSADLLIANNVLAHNPNIRNFVESIKRILSLKGTATIEFPHFFNLYKELQFDTVYHEHFYYFTLKSLNTIFNYFKLTIWDVEELKTHGGSLRLYISHESLKKKISKNVKRIINKENKIGLFKAKTFLNFSKKVNIIKRNSLSFINQKIKNKKKIAVYGAAAKGNTFLNYLKLDNKKITTAFDLAKIKIGKYLPGSKIKVEFPSKKLLNNFDVIIILPWNLKKEITLQLKREIKKNCELFICIPKIIKTN